MSEESSCKSVYVNRIKNGIFYKCDGAYLSLSWVELSCVALRCAFASYKCDCQDVKMMCCHKWIEIGVIVLTQI